jgi:probable rRNA maturation factor
MRKVRLPQVVVLNRQRKIALDRVELEEFARRALPLCAREGGAGLTNFSEVTIVLVSDRKISELHRRFMQIEGPTDVISFQHGEIFISVETAQRQAKTYGTSLGRELRLYLVHGLLHLQGFDDDRGSDRERMSALQERILASILERSAG